MSAVGRRVLVVTGSLKPGGAEKHAVTLMNRLVERGHETHSICVKRDVPGLEDGLRLGVHGTSACLGAARYFDRRALGTLASRIAHLRPAVVVAANPYALMYAWLAMRMARSRGALVVIFHSNRMLNIKERLQLVLYRLFFWTADLTIFVCEKQRRYWTRRGVCSRRNAVVYNGVDLEAFRADANPQVRACLRKDLGFGDTDYVIGLSAMLRPEKNHLQLVDAVARLRSRGIPARALLIGDGATRGAIERRASAQGVREHVVFAGFRDDVRPCVGACDVMVLCSFTEGLSLAAIEAMALGKPLVHSDVGGAAEMITPGREGYLFPAGDTTAFVDRLALLADPSAARRMGRQARLAVEAKFSEDVMVDRYEHLLMGLRGGMQAGGCMRNARPGRGRHSDHGPCDVHRAGGFDNRNVMQTESDAVLRPRSPAAAAMPVVIVLGPNRDAMSGVSMHVDLLLRSQLARQFTLLHFQVGSEGRTESRFARLTRFLLSPLSLALAIRRGNAAVVHVNTSLNVRAYWRDLGYLTVSRLCGARVVYQVHGGALPELFARGHPIFRRFLWFTLRLPDAVVVLARSEFEAYAHICAARQLACIPNGVESAAFGAARRGARNPSEPLRFIYVGRLVKDKGLVEAMEALRLSILHGLKAQLVLVGGGPEEAHLRRRAEELGIAADVLFPGPIHGPAKSDLLGTADVFLLPSYSEGLPYALLEAMAAGLPVIATPVGAIPDVVIDGVHGFLVPPRDPVAISDAMLALADRTRLEEIGRACRARVAADYSLEEVAAQFASLYSDLLSPRFQRAGRGAKKQARLKGAGPCAE